MAGKNGQSSGAPSGPTQRAVAWAPAGAALLVAAVFAVYQPAWQAGMVWDDDSYVRQDLDSWHGLGRIWSDVRATQQYFPLLHTAFWLQYKLWGDWPTGYHLVSIGLHGLGALLLWRVLRRLEVPGAYVAATIFALHPVHVESVAWIAELKNTLSGVFFLGAAWAYVAFDDTRKDQPQKSFPTFFCTPHAPREGKHHAEREEYGWYGLAMALFAAAVLSKTTTAPLPALLLAVLWWKRGRLGWKRDVGPLVPFFVIGAALGLITWWVEYRVIGAEGREFSFTVIERGLVAGRAFWFYLGKLFWPADLMFFYPRWEISARVGWQYLYPLGAMGLLAGLWLMRRWSRAPLACVLVFAGALFPVSGLFNLYVFRYSLVTDHFQYLPSLGVIALVGSVVGVGIRRRPAAGVAVWLAMVMALGILTWRQSRMYHDGETLYRVTLQRNPKCWMAYNNLGRDLLQQGRPAEGLDHLERAARLRPEMAEIRVNLGNALTALGRQAEAVKHLELAVKLEPENVVARNNLGNALADLDRVTEAVEQFQEALRIEPDYYQAINNLAVALVRIGRTSEALEQYRRALRIQPDRPEAHYNLAMLLIQSGRRAEAVEHFRQALYFQPGLVQARVNLMAMLAQMGNHREAIAEGRELVRLAPGDGQACLSLARMLAFRSSEEGGDAAEAMQMAQRGRQLMGERPDAACLDTLAGAYAAAGRFPEAVATANEARRLAEAEGQSALAEEIHMRLQLYRDGKPWREPPAGKQ